MSELIRRSGRLWRVVAAAACTVLTAVSIAWGGYVLHRLDNHEGLEGHPMLLGRYNANEKALLDDLHEMKGDIKAMLQQIGEIRGRSAR